MYKVFFCVDISHCSCMEVQVRHVDRNSVGRTQVVRLTVFGLTVLELD